MNIAIAIFAFIGICVVGIAVGIGLFFAGLLAYDRFVVSQMGRR